MKLLDGRVALVTGGSRGLGRAICSVFAREGASVAFNYVSQDQAASETLAALATPKKRSFKVSVTDREGIATMVNQIEAELGPIDVLVNNAGITDVARFAMIDEKDWDRVLDVNVKGPYLVTHAVARGMIRRKYGRILNIGSIAGQRTLEAPVHYATSKAAMNGFTFALARELTRYGILVNNLVPGLLDDGVGLKVSDNKVGSFIAATALNRLGCSAEIAELAAFLCSERNSYMTGSIVTVDGGSA